MKNETGWRSSAPRSPRSPGGPDAAAAHIQIKAAGGVRTLDDLLAVRALGMTRIGATATKVMLNEAIKRGFAGSLPRPHLDGVPATPAGY